VFAILESASILAPHCRAGMRSKGFLLSDTLWNTAVTGRRRQKKPSEGAEGKTTQGGWGEKDSFTITRRRRPGLPIYNFLLLPHPD
jgi:hypothetical protein